MKCYRPKIGFFQSLVLANLRCDELSCSLSTTYPTNMVVYQNLLLEKRNLKIEVHNQHKTLHENGLFFFFFFTEVYTVKLQVLI